MSFPTVMPSFNSLRCRKKKFCCKNTTTPCCKNTTGGYL